MNAVTIIVGENCKKCEAMKSAVAEILSAHKIRSKIRLLQYSTDEAVGLAIRHGFSQVPAVVVNGWAFTEFNESLFLEALKG